MRSALLLSLLLIQPLRAQLPVKELRPGMTFVQVPENDQHPSYWIQQHETTRSAWRTVMRTEPWKIHDTFSRAGDTIPAAFVSWLDVQQYIQALNATDFDHVYRLPTEKEWEEACRAGQREEPRDLGAQAWYDANAFATSTDKFTHPVGQKAPNAWGLYDCLGNAWEWVEDRGEGQERILKGGSWRTSQAVTRAAERNRLDEDQFAGDLGFRLVATPVHDSVWSDWMPLERGGLRLSWRCRWISSNGREATWSINVRNEEDRPVEAQFQWGLGTTNRNEMIQFEASRIREINAALPRTEKGQRPFVTLLDCRPTS